MVEKIKNILNEVLPKAAFRLVSEGNGVFGGKYIKIAFAVSDYNINGISGQKVQVVSLNLELNCLELTTQIFGGNGGQSIYRKPNLNDPKEKYLAMKSVKVPFKRPKPEEQYVLSAIKRFAENWLKTLKENRDVLMYQELVNYDEFLN
jgi:hypothetical protein